MTKKKKRQNPEIDDLLARPWCYYCERDFDDLKILIHHQKAKHFKCDRCARRLNTAGGLRVHMEQVHKETLEQVENALPGRESIDLEIFGTEGIPESEVAAHNQRIMAEYAQKEADRRAASGHSNAPKKPKIDISKELDPEEIKKKLEAHKKAMASGGVTQVAPNASPQANSPPTFPPNQFVPPHSNAFLPTNTFPSVPFAPQTPTTFPASQYGQAPFPQQPPVGYGHGSAPQAPYNGYQHPPGGFSASGFSGPPPPASHGQFPQAPPPHIPPRQPPQGSSLPLPHQIPGLPPKPSVPGLPARPTFANPPGGFGRGNTPGAPLGQRNSPAQHQQQPHGFGLPPPVAGYAGLPPYPGSIGLSNQPQPHVAGYGQPQQSPPGYVLPQSSSATQIAPPTSTAPAAVAAPVVDTSASAPVTTTPETTVEKKSETANGKPKKETRLVYQDNDASPEEKRTMLPRYMSLVTNKAAG